MVSACGISTDRESYPEQLIDAQCDFDKRCNEAEFWYEYANIKDCVDENLSFWRDIESSFADCSFNEEKGAECLEWLAGDCRSTGQELDQLTSDCESAWRCDL